MYPSFELGGYHIELTGLGIIVSIFCFYGVARLYAKRKKIATIDLFYFLPTMILITYLTGSYFAFVLSHGRLLPYSILEVGQIIIPANYGFNAAGLSIGLLISIFSFLYHLPERSSKKVWLDILALASTVAVSLLGLFLILGDHMIGLPTTVSSIAIYALTPFSELNKFTTVLPVGLFLSIAAILSYLISLLVLRRTVYQGRGFGTLAILFFLLAIVLIFQTYPRHAVIRIDTIQIDFNQYILILLSILLMIGYMLNYRKYKILNKTS